MYYYYMNGDNIVGWGVENQYDFKHNYVCISEFFLLLKITYNNFQLLYIKILKKNITPNLLFINIFRIVFELIQITNNRLYCSLL